uniref:Carboxypeptidase regulatory-like domain-containing protein n=1 Tax=candidate division WOR-3 bacterium TaxID=2052148 RepID=A0A7C4U8D2_UNCW3
MIFFIIFFNLYGYSEKKLNLNIILFPGIERLETLHIRLTGKGRYELFCSPINKPDIVIKYSSEDVRFKPLDSNTRIFEGSIPNTGEKEITLILSFFAPFTLSPKEYSFDILLWTKGDVKIEKICDIKNHLNGESNPKITLNYFIKDRLKSGEKIKVKGTISITEANLTKGTIKLLLPKEISYQENSFCFNDITLQPTKMKDNLLLFNIGDIQPGIYNFEYVILLKPWVESKIIFISMGMSGWIGEEYVESPDIVRWIYLESDIFYENGIVLGRVYDKNKKGIKGAILFLEDGTRSITDNDGRYSFQWVKPGRHIVSFKNYKRIIDLPPGGIYLLDFETEESRIGPKNEIVFLSLGEATVSGIKKSGTFEKLPIDGKLTMYFIGEIRGDILIEALVNTDGREISELPYLIRPEEKYKVFADYSHTFFGNEGKFYVMIKKNGDYLNAGFVSFGEDILGFEKEMLGTTAKKDLGPINFIAQAGIPKYLYQQEEFLVSSNNVFQLKEFPVIINSERVYLETRDILDLKTVLSSKLLIRDKDYFFDYQTGRLFLAQYIFEEITMNPRFVVVKYQSIGNYKNIKDINWRLQQSITLPNFFLGLGFNRFGSQSEPYHILEISENNIFKNIKFSFLYARRIENVENPDRYKIDFSLSVFGSQINATRSYIGKGLQMSYPDCVPVNSEENSVFSNIDLHFMNLYFAPGIKTFKEEKDGNIRNGISKEIEFGWRNIGYNQKAFIKLANTRTDGNEYWHFQCGYTQPGFYFSPFFRFSNTQKFAGGVLEFGNPKKIKLIAEEEYGIDLYSRNSISVEKSALNGRFTFIPKITYEKRMIDENDYISSLLDLNLVLEPISLNTNFDYRRYLKIKKDMYFASYRVILWPFNDISFFFQSNILNKELRLSEIGFAYRPLWFNSVALLGMCKYSENHFLGAIDLGIIPFKNLNITIGNGFSRDLRYHQAKLDIKFIGGFGLGFDAGLMNKERLIGGNIYYEFSPLRLTIGYNYINREEVTPGFYFRIITNPMFHWSLGLEENALELLDKFIIEIPPVIPIGEKFKMKVTALDKEGKIFTDFIGTVEMRTKSSVFYLRFKPENKGEKTFQLLFSDTTELGPNYVLIRDKKGRTFYAFFYLRRLNEIVTYPEPSTYLPTPISEVHFSHFKIDVPREAIAGEPFMIEIIAIDNRGEVFESFTNGIEILTSNHEKVSPDKLYFAPKDKGRLKASLIYPGVETIRLIIRPINEPLKVSISEPIVFTKKGAPPPKPKPEERKTEVKKPSPEEIQNLFKEGLKYFAEGNYEAAEKIWKKILSVDPTNEKAKKYLKDTQLRLKKK